MTNTIDSLKIVLANTFTFYLKVHFFHWNVEGAGFPQYHKFLGDLYEEVYGSVDDIAEHIRQLGSYSPGSLTRFRELSSIADADDPSESPRELFETLRADNEKVMNCLEECYLEAEKAGQYGLSNFLQDRLMAHSKHRWQIESTLKGL